MNEKAKCVCFIYMQAQNMKMKFKSVQINMKQVSYKSMNDRFYLSHHIKITLKSHFWQGKGKVLSLCTQCFCRRHFITFSD